MPAIPRALRRSNARLLNLRAVFGLNLVFKFFPHKLPARRRDVPLQLKEHSILWWLMVPFLKFLDYLSAGYNSQLQLPIFGIVAQIATISNFRHHPACSWIYLVIKLSHGPPARLATRYPARALFNAILYSAFFCRQLPAV